MQDSAIPDSTRAPAEMARAVRDLMPAEGLFSGQTWRTASGPFRLGPRMVRDLDALGRVLLQFYRSLNLLYRRSAEGREPGWIASVLDQGKPQELVSLQRAHTLKNHLPRVIRPDILLTDEGFSITELDSIPGGIGLTAWLNHAYSQLGCPVIGGPTGMVDGFKSIFGTAPQVHLVVSDEAAAYRPEMEWMAAQLGADRFHVRDGTFSSPAAGDAVYRFFELFDLPNVPGANTLFDLGKNQQIVLTPPPKSFFEEKLMFALLWNRNLKQYWRQELGEGFLTKLQQHVPRTWILDPSPLPPQAAYPGLDLTDWEQLKALSQKERDLILKISGFSPKAWGARGVFLGSDLSQSDWAGAVDGALRDFPQSPHILQRYDKPALVEAEWFDFDTGQPKTMKGRVRLCPYYFVSGEGDAARAKLGGVLATICPADKKIIHGMSDAILAPCSL
jgi:hypothetical protein